MLAQKNLEILKEDQGSRKDTLILSLELSITVCWQSYKNRADILNQTGQKTLLQVIIVNFIKYYFY